MSAREMVTVIFSTTGEAGDEYLIREYILDAIDRLPNHPRCTGVGFNPFARKANLHAIDVDGGVLLRVWGSDVDAVIEEERDRWKALVTDGIAQSWSLSDDDDTLTEYLGGQGADRYLQYLSLASQLSTLVYEEFEDTPDPVDEYPDEDREAPTGVGWWRLLHEVTIQQNLPYTEEIAAYRTGLHAAIHSIAEFDDPARARQEIDALIDSLDTLKTELPA